jgi:hypothetical protein
MFTSPQNIIRLSLAQEQSSGLRKWDIGYQLSQNLRTLFSLVSGVQIGTV